MEPFQRQRVELRFASIAVGRAHRQLELAMKRILSVAALAATVALGGLAVSSQAEARNGGAVAAGVIGGLAVGAIVGGAAAQQRGYYDGPNYAVEPAYAAPGGACVERREVWSNRYQNYVVRNVRVPC
jgi:hypothetical protein